jgi:hypothetical protein
MKINETQNQWIMKNSYRPGKVVPIPTIKEKMVLTGEQEGGVQKRKKSTKSKST